MVISAAVAGALPPIWIAPMSGSGAKVICADAVFKILDMAEVVRLPPKVVNALVGPLLGDRQAFVYEEMY